MCILHLYGRFMGCGPGSSTAILSTYISSTLGSSKPVLSTIKLILCKKYKNIILTCLPNN